MHYVYETLSELGETFFEDLERDEKGHAKIDGIKIVYSMDGVFQLTDNQAKKDIPLVIDIWSRQDEVYEVEDLVSIIDGELDNYVYRTDTLRFMLKKANNWTMNLRDEDKNIRRKRMNYVVNYYK